MAEQRGFEEAAAEILDAMADEVDVLRVGTLGSGADLFVIVLRAAFAKCFDFARSAFGDRTTAPFFVLGTLRGIVEDTIVLTTLSDVPEPERGEVLSSWMTFNLEDDMVSQRDYFAADGRGQIVLARSDDEPRTKAKAKLFDAIKAAGLHPGWGTGNMKEWARTSGLLEVYEFHYAAASRLVHFSPRVLLRTGWSKDAGPDAEWTFSVTNFERYYEQYHQVWGCDLLVRFVRRLGDLLEVTPELDRHIEHLEAAIADELRLPELVTFEELNLEPPPPMIRVLSRVVAESAEDPSERAGLMSAALDALNPTAPAERPPSDEVES